MKGSYNFQGVLRRKVWRYKKWLGYTFKKWRNELFIWYTKVFFNPLKHFQKIKISWLIESWCIEVTDLQKLGYYWIFVLSINVNKSEIFKQNLCMKPTNENVGACLVYIVIRIVYLCTSLEYDSCRKCFCCKILTLVD